MSPFFLQNLSAFNQTVNFVGTPFQYNGVTHNGVVNFLDTSEVIDFGGFQSHLAATIAIACNVMITPPNKGEKVTINGTERRVINVTNNNQISWHISLEDISR